MSGIWKSGIMLSLDTECMGSIWPRVCLLKHPAFLGSAKEKKNINDFLAMLWSTCL